MTPAEGEFEAPVRLDATLDGPVAVERAAAETELAAIAARLHLPRIESLRLEGRLKRMQPGDIYAATGQATMTAERECIVTLEPFMETTVADFEELFTTSPEQATVEDDEDPGAPDELEIELIEGETIDLGEIALQYLAMALDPYPRKPGAKADESAEAPKSEPAGRRPFAGLDRMLRERQEKD